MGGPTIKDVARAARVSPATVSYVMNNLNKVSPAVDSHVRQMAAELGYQRNRTATALKTGRTHAIGCIVPTLISPVFPEIVQAVQRRAEERGLATFVIDSGLGDMREAEAAAMLARHGIDGAVAVLSAEPQIIDPPPFPIVVIDRGIPGFDSVQADHLAGGRLMAEHAMSLGHKRIGLLSGEQDLLSSRDRRQGFLEASQEGRLEIVWDVQVPLTSELPDEAVRLLACGDVTFVACVNDLVALSALGILKARGFDVPGDISVMGFDDVQLSSSPLVSLTTVRQSLADLGRQAVDLLVRRIGEPACGISNETLPVQLIQRSSTGALPGTGDR